ncbi:uncharacterized protein K452DRAFT_226905, partial [Aplosporella prunicola CBS 121167]
MAYFNDKDAAAAAAEALPLAAQHGHASAVHELLDAAGGADVAALINDIIGDAVWLASAGGHKDVVELLLDRGGKRSLQPQNTHYDAWKKSGEADTRAVICMLLDHGADANAKDGMDSRYGLLLQMAAADANASLVELLLARGVDVNAAGFYYGTALQAAARHGHEAMVSLLLAAGADVNALQGRYHTPLRAAVVGGH